MCEMWKRKQIHEDARKMHQTTSFANNFGEMEKASFGRSWLGQKNGQIRRSPDMLHKMLGIR